MSQMFPDVQRPKGYVTGLMELYAKLEAEKGSSKSISLGAIKDAIFQLIAAYNNVELMVPVVRETKPKGEEKPAEKPPAKSKGRGKKETISAAPQDSVAGLPRPRQERAAVSEQPAKVETISEKRKGKSKPAPPPEPTPPKEEEDKEEVIAVPPWSEDSESNE